jgi:hypothetical protein
LLAALDELGNAKLLDFSLVLEPEFFLDLDLDPESLAVESVLEALVLAKERVKSLKNVLVGAAPSVVHAHRIIGGDWTVDERKPPFCPVVLVEILFDSFSLFPPREKISFQCGKIDLGWNVTEC